MAPMPSGQPVLHVTLQPCPPKAAEQGVERWRRVQRAGSRGVRPLGASLGWKGCFPKISVKMTVSQKQNWGPGLLLRAGLRTHSLLSGEHT